MNLIGADELILVRHGPTDHGGRLAGRFDPPLKPLADKTVSRLQLVLSGASFVVSPARRCQETAVALAPNRDWRTDARLWEQDFGVEDGALFSDLPDLGVLSLDELANRRPKDGESFADMTARVRPGLEDIADRLRNGGGPIAVVAHAGTVRAGLALALGRVPEALAFEIAPLSATRLRCLPSGFSIISVNESLS